MKKNEFFQKAVTAMDNYTRAIEMEASYFENYYYCKMREYLAEIRARGWAEEFDDFALVL